MGILMAGYLPAEDRQGVAAMEPRLLAEPDLELVVIGQLVQHSLTTYRGDAADEREPTLTIRWQSIEPVTGQDANDVLAMLARVRSDRIGADELPGVAEAAARTPRRSPRSRRSHLSTVDQ